jgi:EGF-like domain
MLSDADGETSVVFDVRCWLLLSLDVLLAYDTQARHESYCALGSERRCRQGICANRGICVQEWNTFTCDCDFTSFTGPTCSDGNNQLHTLRRCSIKGTIVFDPRPCPAVVPSLSVELKAGSSVCVILIVMVLYVQPIISLMPTG